MIRIDHQNTMEERVGARNGLKKGQLEAFAKKHQPLVSQMMAASDQEGYAFLSLPDDLETVREIERFAKGHRGWENVAILGIGGSALGGIALQEALLGPWHNLKAKTRLFFLDNVDPDHISQLLNSIDLRKTLFVLVSKSGTNIEPLALWGAVKERLEKKFHRQVVVVTDPEKGPLRAWAEREKIASFPIPPKVGGRFSVLTPVGLLPSALGGIDIWKLVEGAKKMKKTIRQTKGMENPALGLACLQYLMDREKGKPMTVMMPYSNRLFRAGDWYRQLIAESLGKNKDTGPTPIIALGATDQHSQLQLYNQGPQNKWFIFLRVERFEKDLKLGKSLPKEVGFLNGKKMGQVLEADYQGTATSLARNGRPNMTLHIARIDEEHMGALLMLLECQMALLGSLYNVNAFDQPGVEESKRLTRQLLSRK